MHNRWTAEQANAWTTDQGWLVGCNYLPATAANSLEMWQADTFDPATVDTELGWARSIGLSSVRVFLHHLLWEDDPHGFRDRIERFLDIAGRHEISVMPVLFDSCFDPEPRLGPQRVRPGVHNSAWVQCPGRGRLADSSRYGQL